MNVGGSDFPGSQSLAFARALILAVAIAVLSLAAAKSEPALPDDLLSQSIEQLTANIEHKHPAAALVLAKRLFEGGRQDEAVFWFYLGQLRYRAYLKVHPELDPSGEPALFASLMEVLGRPINLYAFGDIPGLVAVIDRVIAWDDGHADDFAPPGKAREEITAGLVKMRADIIAKQDDIRRQRRERGLPNRNP
jgi:hypothetical protein